MEQRLISEIVYRPDLYPRFKPNPTKIQQYAENIEYEGAGESGIALKINKHVIGLISNGTSRCVEKFWLDLFWEHLQRLPKLPLEPKEDDYRNTLASEAIQ